MEREQDEPLRELAWLAFMAEQLGWDDFVPTH
jgi:hypothetical protein